MPTRQEVLDGIETINDNGNNTALEVRTVLRSLLDYTENDDIPVPTPGGSNVDFFHFWTEDGPIDSDLFSIWYSFKGIQKQTVNFTFRIESRGESFNDFSFEVSDEIYETLINILEIRNPNFPLWFSVPVFDRFKIENREVGFLRLDLSTPNLVSLTIDSEMQRTTPITVFTSIQFHAPAFNFDQLG